MRYGYARVSTDDQNSALQLAALRRAGCKTIFEDEGISGATTSALPCSAASRPSTRAHTSIVWKLDGLGRSAIRAYIK
jgi:DNA invertase Pin-like site-specific DNA recombinase